MFKKPSPCKKLTPKHLMVFLLIAILLCSSLTACSGGKTTLVGKWVLPGHVVTNETGEVWGGEEGLIYEFSSDGTFIMSWLDSYNKLDSSVPPVEFTYIVNGNQVQIHRPEGSETNWIFTITGNTLRLATPEYPDDYIELTKEK